MAMSVPRLTMADIEEKNRRDRKRQAKGDIKIIDEALESNNEEKLREIHSYMDGKYQAAITDWGLSLYGFSPEYGLIPDSLGIESLSDNLKKMKAKIEAYGEGKNIKSNGHSSININAISESRSEAAINVAVSFSNAKEMISDLTALSDDQVEALQEKIDELQGIVESDDKRREKWKKAAPIFKYMIDKGIDVAKIVLPLVTSM